jgi:hypothetical protein
MGVRYGIWDPLGPQTQARMSRHDIVCFHTMVGSLAGTSSMFHRDGYGGTESHFGVAGDGTVRQWQDTDYVAEANLNGNHRIISIETADYGEPAFGKWDTANSALVPAWTGAQIQALAEITAACCDAYDIPIALVPDSLPTRRGIAYHRQGIDPWRVADGELWSAARGKACPGDRRIAQVPRVIELARSLAGLPPADPTTTEVDLVQNFHIPPGTGSRRFICPVGSASGILRAAWISAVVEGPSSGKVRYWFQADDRGISDVTKTVTFADGRSGRAWHELPDGTTQVNVQYEFPEGGVLCLETLPR